MLGLVRSGSIVLRRTEVEEIRKVKPEARGAIITWGGPRDTQESMGCMHTGLCQRSQGSQVCILGGWGLEGVRSWMFYPC